MITNRMRRMSKRRQKIELRRQAQLVAQAVDLNHAVTEQVTSPSAAGAQAKTHSSPAPAGIDP